MIYLHIPFCRSFCIYCDFYSEVVPGCRGRRQESEDILFSDFGKAVCKEAELRKEEILSTLQEDTLYIGGGTPSVLPFSVLSGIVTGMNRAVFGIDLHHYKEFTVEVNPEDILEKGPDFLAGLKALGVTRVSMGVQSFDDTVLKWMNRRHDAAGARKAFSMLRDAGFRDISIDFIFGISGVDDGLWRKTLEGAVSLQPEHISAYQLSVEPGSALARMSEAGKYEEADEETCRRQYGILCSMLKEAGYHHYEISNFAKPGHEAVHNSAYWRRVPYAGLGPGAHSALADEDGQVRSRSWNKEAAYKYTSLLQEGALPEIESERLDDEDVKVENIMLGLRTDAGIPEVWLSFCKKEFIDRMLAEGVLERFSICSGKDFYSPCHTRFRIPEDHMFVSDEIIRELCNFV